MYPALLPRKLDRTYGTFQAIYHTHGDSLGIGLVILAIALIAVLAIHPF